jgi:hypothetical protein
MEILFFGGSTDPILGRQEHTMKPVNNKYFFS